MTAQAATKHRGWAYTLRAFRRRIYYRVFAADGALRDVLSPGAVVLDAGCSDGRGTEMLREVTTIGLDIYEPALRVACTSGRVSAGVVADLRWLPFHPSAFDFAVSLDVIEHFTKDAAWGVIREFERVAREVVVVTPSGFVAQAGTDQEPHQEHRSGWFAAELESDGYEVSGLGGWRAVRGPYAAFRAGPLGALIAAVTGPMLRRRPDAAYYLFAHKLVGDRLG